MFSSLVVYIILAFSKWSLGKPQSSYPFTKISKQDLEELDKLEGYPDLYDRIIVEVEDDKGNKYNAFAYTMVEKNLELPPDHYYEILVKGYEDWGLPKDHLEKARII